MLRIDQGPVLGDRQSGLDGKSGIANDLPPIDTCGLAVQLGATFVARSFSGDKKQLQSILKAALAHRGTAVLDVVSPCVTFIDHVGSTKSYKYVRDNKVPLQSIGFVPHFEEIQLQEEFAPGTVREVEMHDGSCCVGEDRGRIRSHQSPHGSGPHRAGSGKGPDPDRGVVREHRPAQFTEILNLDDVPLAQLGQDRLRPPKSALDAVMEELA